MSTEIISFQDAAGAFAVQKSTDEIETLSEKDASELTLAGTSRGITYIIEIGSSYSDSLDHALDFVYYSFETEYETHKIKFNL